MTSTHDASDDASERIGQEILSDWPADRFGVDQRALFDDVLDSVGVRGDR